MAKHALLAICLLLSTSGCVLIPGLSTNNLELFDGPEFSFTYPSSFKKVEESSSSIELKTENSCESFKMSSQVATSSSLTVEQERQIAETTMKSLGATILSSELRTLDGCSGYCIKYKLPDTEMDNLNYWLDFPRNGKDYRIFCFMILSQTLVNPNPSQNQREIDDILTSLKWKN